MPASGPTWNDRSPVISGGSVLSSSAAWRFCLSVASGIHANNTTCLINAVPSLAGGGRELRPGEHPQRILQHRADVAQHGRAEVAVDDAMVEREGQGRDLPHRELALVNPRRIFDLSEREDSRLTRREYRCSGVHAEDADVRHRDGGTAQVGRCGPAGPRGLAELGEGAAG